MNDRGGAKRILNIGGKMSKRNKKEKNKKNGDRPAQKSSRTAQAFSEPKKKVYWIVTALQVLLVGVCYFIQRLSVTRMGMMRHVMYFNQKWTAELPISTIINGLLILAVIASWSVLLLQRRHTKGNQRFQRLITMETSFVITGYLIYLMMFSVESLLSYYFVGMVLTLAIVLEIGKAVYYILHLSVRD